MPSIRLRIANERGLHARAAAKFVAVVGGYDAEVTVAHHDMSVSGTSIMGLLLLAAGRGCEIEVAARGLQEADVLEAVRALVEARFGEE